MSTTMTSQQRTASIRQYQGETVVYIPLSELHPFPDQPFKVRDDKAMAETVESVREYGVLTPAIVRPCGRGGYEIVSGHRRKHASELAGVTALPAIIREMDDDAAIILLVDSNIQREEILPSERGQAYKMKMDALKRRAGRPVKDGKNNSPQVAANFRSDDEVAKNAGISGDTVRRYVRLTELIPTLQARVDEGTLPLTVAVELSYLMPDEQSRVAESIESKQTAPSLSHAQKMKKLSQAGELDGHTIRSIMAEEKKPPADHPKRPEPPNPDKLPLSPAAVSSPAVPPPSNVPFDLGDKQYGSFAESIADLKNNDKDCSCTPDLFLAEFTGFVCKFHKEINWFHLDYYEAVFPALSPAQLDYLRQQMDEIRTAVDKLYNHVKGT